MTCFVVIAIVISLTVVASISGLYMSTWGGNSVALGNTAIDNITNNIIFKGSPSHTFYLSSKLFPITAIGSYSGNIYGKIYSNLRITVKYVFYGTPQPDGTECISGVAVYPISLINDSFSSIPAINTTNPEEVAKIYYYSQVYFNFNIKPNKYTLLCPNIITAIK